MRIMQTMVSGKPLVFRVATRMRDPDVYVVFRAPGSVMTACHNCRRAAQTMEESVGLKEHSRMRAFCGLDTLMDAMYLALSHIQYMSVQSCFSLGDLPVCVSRYLLSDEKATQTNSGASDSGHDRVFRFLDGRCSKDPTHTHTHTHTHTQGSYRP